MKSKKGNHDKFLNRHINLLGFILLHKPDFLKELTLHSGFPP